MSSYRNLMVWQRAMGLATGIYKMTRDYPAEEKFGMVSQMWRAATSISANIAEGQSRKSDGEFRRFLRISQGSLAELETFVMLSERLDLLAARDAPGWMF